LASCTVVHLPLWFVVNVQGVLGGTRDVFVGEDVALCDAKVVWSAAVVTLVD